MSHVPEFSPEEGATDWHETIEPTKPAEETFVPVKLTKRHWEELLRLDRGIFRGGTEAIRARVDLRYKNLVCGWGRKSRLTREGKRLVRRAQL